MCSSSNALSATTMLLVRPFASFGRDHRFAMRTAVLHALILALSSAGQAQLEPGTYLASTSGGKATNGIHVVDTYRRTSRTLSIRNLDYRNVSIKKIWIEDRRTFLVAVNDHDGGHVVRCSWIGEAWHADWLDTVSMPRFVLDVVRLGHWIYVVGASGGNTATDTVMLAAACRWRTSLSFRTAWCRFR